MVSDRFDKFMEEIRAKKKELEEKRRGERKDDLSPHKLRNTISGTNYSLHVKATNGSHEYDSKDFGKYGRVL